MVFGLCVIGCGGFARIFAQALGRYGAAGDLALYFASRDGRRAAVFAAEFGGAGSFGSYESAVSDTSVDAVYVCTPHHLHLAHARLAAAAGKHILMEKPLGRDVTEAQAIVNIAADAGVTLMVAENYRFMPPVQAAKGLLDDATLGSLRLAQLQEQFPFNPTGWRRNVRQNGGGTLIDGGIHKFSILTWLAGSPAEVYAAQVPSAASPDEGEDGVVAMLRYAPPPEGNGMVGIVNHSWSVAPHTPRPWVSLAGSAGSAVFDLGDGWIDVMDASGRQRMELEGDPSGIAAMVREFRESVVQGRAPAVTGADGVRDVGLVQAAYASMRMGAAVLVDAFLA